MIGKATDNFLSSEATIKSLVAKQIKNFYMPVCPLIDFLGHLR